MGGDDQRSEPQRIGEPEAVPCDDGDVEGLSGVGGSQVCPTQKQWKILGGMVQPPNRAGGHSLAIVLGIDRRVMKREGHLGRSRQRKAYGIPVEVRDLDARVATPRSGHQGIEQRGCLRGIREAHLGCYQRVGGLGAVVQTDRVGGGAVEYERVAGDGLRVQGIFGANTETVQRKSLDRFDFGRRRARSQEALGTASWIPLATRRENRVAMAVGEPFDPGIHGGKWGRPSQSGNASRVSCGGIERDSCLRYLGDWFHGAVAGCEQDHGECDGHRTTLST